MTDHLTDHLHPLKVEVDADTANPQDTRIRFNGQEWISVCSLTVNVAHDRLTTVTIEAEPDELHIDLDDPRVTVVKASADIADAILRDLTEFRIATMTNDRPRVVLSPRLHEHLRLPEEMGPSWPGKRLWGCPVEVDEGVRTWELRRR